MGVAKANELPVIRFGTFEVDPRASELRRNGSRIRLQEQPLQILLALLERPGEVVTREELQKRLWPADTFVDFDHSLNAAVRRLRDALDDSAENPRFVETVARRGYRFIAPLSGAPVSQLTVLPPPLTLAMRLRRCWRSGLVALLLIAAMSVGWHAGTRSRQASPPMLRRLTANAEEDRVTAAALSPDGQHLAFSDRNGLHLREVGSGETHLISLPAGFDARPASWFPDGMHLLATWVAGPREPSSLWEISLLGGQPRKLADEVRWPAVSPDGLHIVFVSGRETKWLGNEASQSIWIMQADGSGQRKLLEDAQSPFGPPVWSPDGRLIAFPHPRYLESKYHSGTVNSKCEIDILNLGSGRVETLLTGGDLDAALAWLPDWRLVYSQFEEPPNEHDSNVWYVRVDPGTARTSSSPSRLTSETGAIGALSSGGRGTRVAITRASIQPDVYVAELENGGTKLGTPQRLTLDERQDFPFAWLPDNESVLFASDREGVFHIFKQALGQPDPDLLVGGNEPASGARLSPDFSYILYIVTPKMGELARARIMRMPVAGGPSQVVLDGDGINNQQCARAPATLCLFSVIDEHRERFFTFDPIKGKGQELPRLAIEARGYASYNWSLSPDGRTLATTNGAQVSSTTSRAIPGVQIVSLSDYTRKTFPFPNWAGIAGLDWAADGKSLWAAAYTTNDTSALLNLDLQGRIRPMLQENKMIVGWAIPSADGRHLALWEASGNSNVWLLDKF